MKLITKENANIVKFYTTGTIIKNENVHGLKKFLTEIYLKDIEWFRANYGKFADGLLYQFQNENLLDSNGNITEIGHEVINTGKDWKTLSGLFEVELLVAQNGCTYVLNINAVSKELKDKERKLKDSSLPIFNDWDQNLYKKINLDSNILQFSKEQVSINVTYDFTEKEYDYEILYPNKYPHIKTNADSTFKVIDTPEIILQNEFEKEEYSDCINYDEINNKMILCNYDYSNNCIKQIFIEQFSKKYHLNANINFDKMELSDFKFSIEPENYKTVRKLLSAYLLQNTENKYCGYDEIAELYYHFNEYFDNLPQITDDTKSIYNNLIDLAKLSSPKSYLKLKAYTHFCDSNEQQRYKRIQKDFSNQQTSIRDIVETMFGQRRNIASIKMLTKYSASNIGISRAINNIAQVVNQNYGIKLTLITTDESKNQNKTQRDWYNKLKQNKNIELQEKAFNELKVVHNRYFHITYTEESKLQPKWIEMPIEFDSLEYKNDFIKGIPKNVGPDDVGSAKELKIYETDDIYINDKIKIVFGLKDK